MSRPTNNDNDDDNNNKKNEKDMKKINSNNNDNDNKTFVDKNDGNDNSRTDSSSIFYIMDGIIDQLNKTKKLFIIMILTVMIIPPIAFMLTFILFGFPFHYNDDHTWFSNKPWGNAIDPDATSGVGFNPSFRFLPLIPVMVVLVWLGIGIRQWLVLSKWDKKYKKYKELQRKVDEKLDDDEKI
ncbi:MAG: hypothetical protein R2685_01860 [Candidatus Nitrosocosmicus sp.]|jgi:hypothetical protein|nr:hypothetical protein [Candidatus Nitrosocosmicus sp.]